LNLRRCAETLATKVVRKSPGARVRSSNENERGGEGELCAMLTSPGRGMDPPPTRPASEIVWCGERNGRV
jgi:hypothetical protein